MKVDKLLADYVSPKIRSEFLAAANRVGNRGFARCSSGNLSIRIDEDLILISASRSWLSRLTEGELAVCRISDGTLVSGNRPSVETGIHTGILRERTGDNVVLHFQSPAATAFCCRAAPANFNIIPEVPFYLGPIGWVPYVLPGSPELATAAVEVSRTHNLTLLQNHGIITVAEDLDHAIQNAEFFELACELLLQNGSDASLLTDEAAKELTDLGASGTGTGTGTGTKTGTGRV